MKDGRTRLAHKAEHAVDLDTGAVVAVTLPGADKGDTTSLDATLCEAGMTVAELAGREAELKPDREPKVNVNGIEELVTDKGYHSGAVLQRVKSYEVCSYIPEKQQKGRRNWQGKPAEQQAVYRIGGGYEAVWQEFTAATWRVGGTQLRTLLRNRRHASLPSPRTGQHFEAAVDSCRSVQLELDPAPDAGCGPAPELRDRSGRLVLFVYLLFRGRINQNRLCRTLCRIRCQVLRELAHPATSPALQKNHHLRHGLLGAIDGNRVPTSRLRANEPAALPGN